MSRPDAPPMTSDEAGQIAAGWTRGDALAFVGRLLGSAELDTPALDARLLVADALGIRTLSLLTERDARLGGADAARLRSHLRRRLAREPVQRILGEAEFWGLPFGLSPETLVPRPDTETVVERALAALPNRGSAFRLLDLGTGSGCLLVSLLHELRAAFGIGIDRSLGAARTARLNAERNGVADRAAFMAGDWAGSLGGTFDLIVSNPPYIRSDVVLGLEPEVVRFDPAAALDGGGDGLASIRSVFGELSRLLAPGGTGLVEIGHDQAGDAGAVAADAGLRVLEVAGDLGGRDRVVVVTNP